MYHLRLKMGKSYHGIVSATEKEPDIYTEDEDIYVRALATGYFEDAGPVAQAQPGAKAPEPEAIMPEPETDTGYAEEHATELAKMTVAELKQYAGIKGITLKSETNKKSILKSITEAEEKADEAREALRYQ